MSHAERVLAQLHMAEEELGPDEERRARIEELQNADATHGGVPVNVIKEWRGGSLLTVRYLDGERRGEVRFASPDELGTWDPETARLNTSFSGP